MVDLDGKWLVERLQAFGGTSDTLVLCLLLALGYVAKGWVCCCPRCFFGFVGTENGCHCLCACLPTMQVAEYSRKQRAKAQRRQANAKEGAFEWSNIKLEVDDVSARTIALKQNGTDHCKLTSHG